MFGSEKLSGKEKLLGAIICIPLFYVEEENVFWTMICSAVLLAIISTLFGLGVDDG